MNNCVVRSLKTRENHSFNYFLVDLAFRLIEGAMEVHLKMLLVIFDVEIALLK